MLKHQKGGYYVGVVHNVQSDDVLKQVASIVKGYGFMCMHLVHVPQEKAPLTGFCRMWLRSQMLNGNPS